MSLSWRFLNVIAVLALIFVLPALWPSVAQAGGHKKQLEATAGNPDAPQAGGPRKFQLPCPGGTESAGESPPKGSLMYCRQPAKGGGYVRTGDVIRWYDNGQKRFEGEYVRDKKHGEWKTFYRNGRKKTDEEWYNGERIKAVQYDKHGKPTKTDETPLEEIRKRIQDRKSHSNPLTQKPKGTLL